MTTMPEMMEFSKGDSMRANYGSHSESDSNFAFAFISECGMPIDKKEDPQFDCVVLCSKHDYENADAFRRNLLEQNPGLYNCVMWDDGSQFEGHIGSETELFDTLCTRSTFVLVYVSPNFRKDNMAELMKDQQLHVTLDDMTKKWSMIPVFEGTKDEVGFKNIPYGLRGKVSLETNFMEQSTKKALGIFEKEKWKKDQRKEQIRREQLEWITTKMRKRKDEEELQNHLKAVEDAHNKQAKALSTYKAEKDLKDKLQREHNPDKIAQKAVANHLEKSQDHSSNNVQSGCDRRGEGSPNTGTVYNITAENVHIGDRNETRTQPLDPPLTHYTVVE